MNTQLIHRPLTLLLCCAAWWGGCTCLERRLAAYWTAAPAAAAQDASCAASRADHAELLMLLQPGAVFKRAGAELAPPADGRCAG